MSLISVQNVSRVYEMGETSIRALSNINLEIEEQNFLSFVGPSGSGKSTLLNLIGCLDQPSEGRILVNGIHVNDFTKKEAAKFRGSNIGFIFQNFNLLPILTVFENIEYPLMMVQKHRKEIRYERVMKYLDAVGMTDQKDKYPSQISGGQKQRVAIARALVTEPKLVLADEPTANLDHASAFKVIALMKKMQAELKTTFIFSTHDPKIVKEAELIYTLEDGKLIDDPNSNKNASLVKEVN